MFLIIISTILLIFIISDYLKKLRINKIFKANGIGGNRFTLPLLGDVLLAIGINTENLSEYLKYWRQKYGKVYRFWCLGKCVLVVQNVEYVEIVLNSSHILKKAFFYDQLSIWLGDGMLLSSGSKWQKTRKAFMSSFHFKILEQYVEIFDQQSHVMVEKLRPLSNGSGFIDVLPLMCSTTLDMLLETAIGVKMSSQSPEGVAYMKAFKRLINTINERLVKPFQHFDIVYKLFFYKSYRSLQRDVKILHEFSENIINQKRAEMANKKPPLDKNENEDPEIGLKQRATFLDLLLQTTIDGVALTNKEIREEVDNFTFGGHDTTTCAISFTLYLLSRHPQKQQKVFEEIVNVMGSNPNEPVVMKNLQEMKYLELVIKESIRLYPAGPIIGRLTEEDHKFGDKIIPRNTHVMITIYALCRDPDYFTNPDEFIPERFECDKINPYAYIPFSAGPRNCMGQKYAFLQMKCVISCIMRHYELLPLGPEVVPKIIFIMGSKTGVNVGFKPRVY